MYERTKQLLEEFKDRIYSIQEEIKEEEAKHKKTGLPVTIIPPGHYVARIKDVRDRSTSGHPFIGIKYYIEEAQTYIWQWEIGNPSLIPLLNNLKGTKVAVRVEHRYYKGEADVEEFNVVKPMP